MRGIISSATKTGHNPTSSSAIDVYSEIYPPSRCRYPSSSCSETRWRDYPEAYPLGLEADLYVCIDGDGDVAENGNSVNISPQLSNTLELDLIVSQRQEALCSDDVGDGATEPKVQRCRSRCVFQAVIHRML